MIRTYVVIVLMGASPLQLCAAPAPAPDPTSSDLVAKGKYLTDAGDCVACHTSKNGQPFAGGLMMNTPFGPLSTPNITPDRATGIGAWTGDQFYAAMHSGLGNHGENLYPAMPYPWYTRVTRADVDAIRAYLNSVPAVHSPRKPSNLAFPFNMRSGITAWRDVFFTAGEFKPDPGQSDEINRGSYLVNGLGHCGECHNARVLAGNSKLGKPLQGAVLDGWYAPNITSDVHEGVGAWSQDELVTYLKTGVARDKSIATGPMAQTIHESLSQLSTADLDAIARYLKSTTAQSSYDHAKTSVYASASAPGAQAYLNYCSSCHAVDGGGIANVIPPLNANAVVLAKGPQDVIRVVLGGMPATAEYAPMPPVGAGMTDQDIADVTNYVRQTWANAAPATAEAGMVADLRKRTVRDGGVAAVCAMDSPPAVAKRFDQPSSSIAPLMRGITEANMPDRVNKIVARANVEAPHASRADLVNGLTAAYCPVILSDAKLSAEQKAVQVGQFTSLVYTRLSSKAPL